VDHSIRGPLDQIPGFGIRILQLGVSPWSLIYAQNEDSGTSIATTAQMAVYEKRASQSGVVFEKVRILMRSPWITAFADRWTKSPASESVSYSLFCIGVRSDLVLVQEALHSGDRHAKL
jgi:uncharacterized membrane protein